MTASMQLKSKQSSNVQNIIAQLKKIAEFLKLEKERLQKKKKKMPDDKSNTNCV